MKTTAFRKGSLLRRVLIFNAAMAGLTVLALSALFLVVVRSTFHKQFLLRCDEVTEFFAAQAQYPLLVANAGSLGKIIDTALQQEDVVFISVLSPSLERPIEVWRRPVASPTAGGTERAAGISSAEDRAGLLEVARPIYAPKSTGMFEWEGVGSQKDLGTVHIGFSTDKQDALFQRVIWSAAGVTVFLLIVIIPAQGWKMWQLMAPARDLIRLVRRVGGGDLDVRATIIRTDEVGELMLAFNQMLDQLSSTTVSRNYVDDVLECMGESLIVVDEKGRIQTVNSATLAMLGYQRGELIGQFGETVCLAAEPLQGVDATATYRTKCGRDIPVLLSTALLRSSDAGDHGVVWLAQDMTAMKRAREELVLAKEAAEQASEAKSSFLATMSHELRTPLNAILGFSQLLELEMSDEGIDRWNEDLAKIKRAGNHLLTLISDILDLSKTESGKMQLSCEVFDPAVLTREVAEEMRPLAAANGNEIIFRQSPQPIAAWGDALRVRQCLLNLVANACKFTKGGSIVINLRNQSQDGVEWCCLNVTDTGIGIAAHDIERLFTDFSQVDDSRTRRYGGTGLGLSISRKLCRLMGGDITLESGLGQGSTFTMRLPAAETGSGRAWQTAQIEPEAEKEYVRI
jgi:signal transduction histidine kinase/HAMP domain-containing protein